MLSQLYELQGILKTSLPQYESKVADLEKLIQEEKVARNEAIDQQKQLTLNAESQRDVWKQEAENCRNNLKIVTKKRSFGCTLKKIFTLGISGCR